MKPLKNHIKDAEFLDAETKRQVEAELAAETEAANTLSILQQSSSKNSLIQQVKRFIFNEIKINS